MTLDFLEQHRRYFTEGEQRSGTRVLVIGGDVTDALFPDEDPIDKYVKIGQYKFRVIGVLKKQGKFMGLFSLDNQANLLPFHLLYHL